MGEINFSKTAVQDAPTVAQPQKLKPVSTSLTVRRPVFNDYVPGFADMRLPRLNIVQGIGGLSEFFEPGQLVYEGSTVFFDPGVKKPENKTEPLEVVILGLLPLRYAEKIQGGQGLLASSLDEVVKFNGTLDWNEWNLKKADGIRLFETFAEFVLAIKQPAHLPNASQKFPFKVDDARYAIGVWGMKGSAYRGCVKGTINKDRAMGCTMEFGFPSHSYLASTRLQPFKNGNKAWVPHWVAHKPSSEAFLKFALETRANAENPQDSGCAE